MRPEARPNPSWAPGGIPVQLYHLAGSRRSWRIVDVLLASPGIPDGRSDGGQTGVPRVRTDVHECAWMPTYPGKSVGCNVGREDEESPNSHCISVSYDLHSRASGPETFVIEVDSRLRGNDGLSRSLLPASSG